MARRWSRLMHFKIPSFFFSDDLMEKIILGTATTKPDGVMQWPQSGHGTWTHEKKNPINNFMMSHQIREKKKKLITLSHTHINLYINTRSNIYCSSTKYWLPRLPLSPCGCSFFLLVSRIIVTCSIGNLYDIVRMAEQCVQHCFLLPRIAIALTSVSPALSLVSAAWRCKSNWW